jgi:hypothetical protein
MERRNFIRALIAVAIGVPIAVEGVTFSRLFYERLFGEGGGGTRAAGERVGTGEDLLPKTDARDTITDMSLEASGESEWTFRLVVEVENTADEPYRLKIGPVSLTDGSTVGETVSTGDLDPGATITITGEWQVPRGADVEAVWAGGRTGSDNVTERVLLAPVDAPA